MTKSIKETFEEIQKIHQQREKEMQEIFKPFLVNWMKDNPDALELQWEQYTPYFNDGEQCEFRVRELQVKLPNYEVEASWKKDGSRYNPAYRESNEDGYSWYGVEDGDINKSPYSHLASGLKQLSRHLNENPEMLQTIFGDHSLIHVTPTTLTVENYSDHD